MIPPSLGSCLCQSGSIFYFVYSITGEKTPPFCIKLILFIHDLAHSFHTCGVV